MSGMNHVKLGPSFFKNEIQMYRNPAMAFFRENTQNSYDAGASRIDIKIEDDGDLKKVTFADNGKGMTLETLRDVYFVLGESTKRNEAQSVGGFGRARLLTCFGQEKYELRTGTIMVEGSGAEWVHRDAPTYKGVELTVWMKTNEDLERVAEQYLKTCHLPHTSVTLNGKKWSDWTYKNKFERSLSFAEVYTNKSKDSGVYVRVNGVAMFYPYLSASFLVIIEIHQDKSREVLQANRDGLLMRYQGELESFVSELNINKQSALREKRSKSIRYEGTGTFVTKKKPKDEDLTEVGLGRELREGMANGDPLVNPIPQTRGRLHSSGYVNEEEIKRLDVPLFNVMVEDDSTNANVRRVIESYYPTAWDLLGERGSRYDKRYGEHRSFRAGVDKYKLLVLWKAACERCIDLLQNKLERQDELSWGVGWAFTDSAAAMHKSDGGTSWLLLNPCKPDGTMAFSLANKRDLVKLISHAAHEVCHSVYSDHDERFANLLNDLLEECMFDLSGILSHMKDSKEGAVEEIEKIASHNKMVA